MFVLTLPPKSADNIVSRYLIVQIDGGSTLRFNLEPTASEYTDEAFVGSEDSIVGGSLVDVDNTGKRSEPCNFEFLLGTTEAPAVGEVGLRIINDEETQCQI